MKTVAIVGRPNVGKSTLFNRLVGKKLALVDDTPGVTRDRRAAEAQLGPLFFIVVDTAGLEDADEVSLQGRMRKQTEVAIQEADVCLFIVDARAGITTFDEEFARLLQKQNRPVIVLANKAEGRAGDSGALEAFSLGLGEPIAISAEHGEGMAELAMALEPFLADSAEEEDDPDKPLMLAIVGRPNAGKSTLINRMIGSDRLLTGPEAGITRDSISVDWQWDGRNVRLWDTAGIRRRARVVDKLEKLSVADALRSIQYAEVVVVLVDALIPFEKQDLHIAGLVADEGRAVVIAVNKWDLVEDRQSKAAELREEVERLLPQIRGVPLVPISALSGAGLNKLMPAVFKVHEIWNRRVSTGKLNRWLGGAQERHPPPAVRGRRQMIRYMTQVKSRPPTFVGFTTRPDKLPDAYLRYLVNGIRELFDMPGIPIRLSLRKGDNPYVKD